MKRFRAATLLLSATVLFFGGNSSFAREVSDEVVIEFWEQDGEDQQAKLDQLIGQFEQDNPGIIVKRVHHETEDLRKNYTSAAIGGAGPDVVLGPNDNLGVFVPGELILPADKVMGKDFFNDFHPVALDCAKYNNVQYMIPDRWGNELCLIINKRLVDKAPQTWEELIVIGKKLKKEGKIQYPVVFNLVEPFFTIPFLKAFGGEVFDNPTSSKAKATLDTPAMLEWCKFFLKMQDEGVIPREADYDEASNLFKEGKAAFLINGPWSYFDYIENAEMDIAIAPIPSINGKYPAPYSAVKGYTISTIAAKDSRKLNAVKKFLLFITGKDAQLAMTQTHFQLPSRISAQQDEIVTGDPLIYQQKLQLDKSISMPILTKMRAIWDAVKPVQLQLFAGKIKPEDAGKKMQKRAEDGIKALGLYD